MSNSIYFASMRHIDAKWNRDNRCIEGQDVFVVDRVTLCTSDQAMVMGPLLMDALSTA